MRFSAPFSLDRIQITALLTSLLLLNGLWSPTASAQWRGRRLRAPVPKGPASSVPIDRKRLLVLDFVDPLPLRQSRRNPEQSATLSPGQVVSHHLVKQLVQARSYVVLDNRQLNVPKPSEMTVAKAVELGRQLGADAVVIGKLEQFELDSEWTGGSVGQFNLRSQRITAHIGMQAQLISTLDGSVIETLSAKAKAQQAQPGALVLGELDGSAFEGKFAGLVNQVTQKAITELSQGLVRSESRLGQLAAVQAEQSQRKKLVVLDLDASQLGSPSSTPSQPSFAQPSYVATSRLISQTLVNQLITENQHVVIYSSQSNWKKLANLTMAEAVSIGRELGGDLVIWGRIAQLELDAASTRSAIESQKVSASVQINAHILNTHTGQQLDIVQVEGLASKLLSPKEFEQQSERAYETLLREASQEAALQISDNLFYLNKL